MKPNISKLYEHTPADSLATLAAGATFRGDTNELNDVLTALQDKGSAEQLRFMHHNGALTNSILTWALDCQVSYGKMLEFKLAALGEDGEITRFARFMSKAMAHRIASLIEAMKQICAGCGLDFEDVARNTGIDDMPLLDEAPSLAEAVSMFIEQYKMV